MSWSDDATLPAAQRVPAVHYGGPEQLFGVTELAVNGSVATATMEVDRRYAGDAGCGAGALAVLVDDVLGYAVVTASVEERWSVSTDITLDLLAPLTPGTKVTASARAVYADETASIAECRVHDGAGRLVALGMQRGRFTAPPPDLGDGADAAGAVTDAIRRGTAGGLAGLIGARAARLGAAGADPRTDATDDDLRAAEAGSSTCELVVGAELGNRFGALHGGVALAASLLAAEAELKRVGAGNALTPTSIRITYPRPIPPGATARFTAAVRHSGRSFAVLEVTSEVDGRVCTSAQVTAHPFAG